MPRTTRPDAPDPELHYSGFRYFGEDGEIRPVLLGTDLEGNLWAADLWANALTRPWLRRLWFEALVDTDLLFREIEGPDLHYMMVDLGMAESVAKSWASLDWSPVPSGYFADETEDEAEARRAVEGVAA